jgi:hypothetical protein
VPVVITGAPPKYIVPPTHKSPPIPTPPIICREPDTVDDAFVEEVMYNALAVSVCDDTSQADPLHVYVLEPTVHGCPIVGDGGKFNAILLFSFYNYTAPT